MDNKDKFIAKRRCKDDQFVKIVIKDVYKPMMRLVIADDDVKVRSALTLILGEDQQCWQIVSCAKDVPELYQIVETEKPDLVLLDWELSMGESKVLYEEADGIRQLKERSPGTRVCVLSCKPQYKETAIQSGADAFVSKVDPPEVFLNTIYGLCEAFRTVSYPLVLKQFATQIP